MLAELTFPHARVPEVTGELSFTTLQAATGIGITRTGIEYKELYPLYQFARMSGWGIQVSFTNGESDHGRNGEADNDQAEDTFEHRVQTAAIDRSRVESVRPNRVALTGNLVSDVRALSGLTVQQIADAVGVTERTVFDWRNKPKQIPDEGRRTLEALHALAATLVGGLGPDGVAAWITNGPDAPSLLIRDGRIEEVRRRALQYEESLAT
jgi:DNA-binding transcriptional regulator YiaG